MYPLTHAHGELTWWAVVAIISGALAILLSSPVW